VCPACDHVVALKPPLVADSPSGPVLSACAACGNGELFKKKGFPHWLGLTILAAACIGFLLLNAWYLTTLAWTVLIGSALIDGALYLAVRDVVVCYDCGAEHGGLRRSGNAPFELTVHERYRQKKQRQKEMNHG
jgi:hypothetical protein